MILKLDTPARSDAGAIRDKKMTKLTLKLVDSASGEPAANVSFETRKIVDGDWQLISQDATDAGGRADIADEADSKDGGYFELLMYFGNYFTAKEYILPQMKFVDIVPLRFGIEPGQADAQVVISFSPYGYTVVRT